MRPGEDLLGAFMSRDSRTFHDPSFDINVFGSVPRASILLFNC